MSAPALTVSTAALLHKGLPRGLRLDLQWSDVTVDACTSKCEGGYGYVSRVFVNGCAFALKQPKVKIALTKRDLRNFVAEVEVQGRVRHPCCVAIFGVCVQPDDPFILMEWVGGGTVYKKLGDEELLPRQRLTCVRQVASALDYLHSCGIIHGDIKSLNVLLTTSGTAKLCDFGGAVQLLSSIASSVSAGSRNTSTTLAWCAPELFAGDSKCAATDMYAFGILMWECYTQEVPFDRVGPGLIESHVKSGRRPAMPPAPIDGFPPDYVALMQECLHQDPSKRPSARDAFRRLVAMDPAATPSQPRPLYRRDTPIPHDLLPCLQHCMQALPSQPRAALAPMLASMVEAASRRVMTPDVQALCAQHGLTLVEAQSISVYTMDGRSYGGTREDSVFYEFNLALRAGDGEQVQRWSAFAKVLCDALDKLPSVSCAVYRGLDQPLTQVSHLYVKGSTVFFNSVTSTTTDKVATLQQFGKGADGRPGTLLRIAATHVKSIALFSAFPDENELVASPNSSFRVAIVLESADVQVLAEFGDLPHNVDLIVLQQLPVSLELNYLEQEKDVKPPPQAEFHFQEGLRMYGEQRFSEAAESWERAALLQHAPSHAHLSDMLSWGKAGVAKDEKRAFELATAGVALGCAHSKGALGRCYVYGLGVAKDIARGLALGRESEAAGSCFGQFVVGKCYDAGLGVAQDYAEAVRLYRLAADQGNRVAQYNLGIMYAKGQGVELDDAEAVRLYRLAADQGDTGAQIALSLLNMKGKNLAEQVALFFCLAEQGHACAQVTLGSFFQKGILGLQDYEAAVRLYRLAADQSYADAQYNLGNMYANGEGVAQDDDEAVRLYRLAADQGNADAQFALGVMYANGEGVAQDDAEAVRWYRLAADQGNAEALKALKN